MGDDQMILQFMGVLASFSSYWFCAGLVYSPCCCQPFPHTKEAAKKAVWVLPAQHHAADWQRYSSDWLEAQGVFFNGLKPRVPVITTLDAASLGLHAWHFVRCFDCITSMCVCFFPHFFFLKANCVTIQTPNREILCAQKKPLKKFPWVV